MDNWKDRDKGRRCRSCISFVRKLKVSYAVDSNKGDFKEKGASFDEIRSHNDLAGIISSPVSDNKNIVGRCRRHAPVGNEGWPVVFETDWCGDFKLDENKV